MEMEKEILMMTISIILTKNPKFGDMLISTKPVDVDKINGVLNVGLMDCFSHPKTKLLGSFHLDNLHIALNNKKYKKILDNQIAQVALVDHFS